MSEDDNFSKGRSTLLSRRDVFFIALAFSILALFYLLLSPDGLTHNGQVMIGILFMAAILWITEPIPLAVTGLMIMIVQPMLGCNTCC
ncbi:sodium:sulfate symporter family protein [Thermoplasmatales archaeon SCGC AB-540-F20]|nr:sodium:sulfate symporter family protein [Thermoplasmatales archaeon SCGC AB-540-F20]